MNFQSFIKYLEDVWLPSALALQKKGKGMKGGYEVETKQLVYFQIGKQKCFLDKESSTTALNDFVNHMKNTPNPSFVTGTAKEPNVSFVHQGNGTIWFADPAPSVRGVKSKEGYWRISNVWIRPI